MEQTRADKLAVQVSDRVMARASEEDGLWYETKDQVEAGLKWGKRKQALLKRVGQYMDRYLTPRERRFLKLRYFEDMSALEIANLTKTDPTTVHRNIRRAVHRLRTRMQASRVAVETSAKGRVYPAERVCLSRKVRRGRATDVPEKG